MREIPKAILLNDDYSIRSYIISDNAVHTAEIVVEAPFYLETYNKPANIILFRKEYSSRNEAMDEVEKRMNYLLSATNGTLILKEEDE